MGVDASGNTYSVDVTPETVSSCPNLFYCFVNVVDVGLRTGDILGNGMDDVTSQEDGLTYADRVTWGSSSSSSSASCCSTSASASSSTRCRACGRCTGSAA